MKPILKVPYRHIPPDYSKLYPAVYTVLTHKDKSTEFKFYFIIDSGADCCLFPAGYGELIGIDIESVKPIKGTGSGGESDIYYHQVDVHFEAEGTSYRFLCRAGFSKHLDDVGLLGREDFFGTFDRVTFSQKSKLITLENTVKLPDHQDCP